MEMALDRLPADDPDRALVLATLCSELSDGSPLERLQALADEALAIAESTVTTPPSCACSISLSCPLLVPSLHEQPWPGRPTPWFGPSGWATRCCCSLRRTHGRRLSSQAGDIDEMDRCIEIMASLGEQTRPADSELDEYIHLAKRAQIAGDTDLAEQLATEALQIGTDCGQPDAVPVLRRTAHRSYAPNDAEPWAN